MTTHNHKGACDCSTFGDKEAELLRRKHMTRRKLFLAGGVVVSSAMVSAQARPDAVDSPRGEDYVDQDDSEQLKYEDIMKLHEEDAKRKRQAEERAYKKRLERLGIDPDGKKKSSDSSPDSKSDKDENKDKNKDSKDKNDGEKQDSLPSNGDGFAEPMKDAAQHLSSGYRTPDRPDHRGQDIAKPEGEPIYAFADGVVADAGPATGFGMWIVIDHQIDGELVSTVYGHMWDNGVLVSTGDEVKAGDHIADEGSNGQSSGPHLHFEIWPGGRLAGGSDVDPAPWIEKATS